MARYKLSIKTSAQKEIEGLGTKAERQRIIKRIYALAQNPRTHGCEKLAGYSDRYRVRQGRYRIVYHIDDDSLEVTVFKVGHRKEIYRK